MPIAPTAFLIPSITKACFLSAFGDVILSCGGNDTSFEEWKAKSFLSAVASSKGVSSQAMTQKIQKFCDLFTGLPQNFQQLVEKLLSTSCSTVVGLASDLVSGVLPAIYGELVEQFDRCLLENQPFFKLPPGKFMPSDATNELWLKASTHEVPTERLTCLEGMSKACAACEAGQSMKEQLAKCCLSIEKGQLMNGICHIQNLIGSNKLLQEPSLNVLAECVAKMLTPSQKGVEALKKLSDHPSIKTFEADFLRLVVTPVSHDLLAALGTFVSKAGQRAAKQFFFGTFLSDHSRFF